MKVKGHTGCLLNERADEQAEAAELGYDDTAQEVCPAPQKFGSLALRTRQHVPPSRLSQPQQSLQSPATADCDGPGPSRTSDRDGPGLAAGPPVQQCASIRPGRVGTEGAGWIG
jgi:hypothetical protein